MPHWKVFVFGGNSGNLSEGGNPQVVFISLHFSCRACSIGSKPSELLQNVDMKSTSCQEANCEGCWMLVKVTDTRIRPPLRLCHSSLSQGDFLNDLCVLNTGSNNWTATSVVGDMPEPRSDTQVIKLNRAFYCVVLSGVSLRLPSNVSRSLRSAMQKRRLRSKRCIRRKSAAIPI